MGYDQRFKDPILHGNIDRPYSVYHTRKEAGEDLILYLHWHEEFELLWVKEGQALFYVEQESVEVREGDVVFVESQKLHHARSLNGAVCSFCAFVFSPEAILENPHTRAYHQFVLPVLQGNIQLPRIIRQDNRLISLLKDIAEAEASVSEGSHLVIRARLMEIWSLLLQSEDTERTGELHPDKERFQDVIHYIQEHYDSELRLSELAEILAVSESQFSRLFHHAFGMTAFQYILRLRVQRACELLQNSQEKIASVAMDCGFGNISHFNRVFLQWVHCTPREYRELARQSGQ